MSTKGKGDSEYDLKSIFVDIYRTGYEAGTVPLNFEGLCANLPALSALPEGKVKDSIRLWFHQQFMTPLWLHLQFGGSGSPGTKALRDSDKLEGVMSGEAVITYMGYRKYVQAGKNALEAGKQASTALWIAIISIGLTIGSIWVSVFAKEIHDTFLPGSQEQSDTEQCLPQGGPAGSHTLLLPTNMDSSKIDTTVQPTLQVDSFGAVDSVLLKH